MKIEELPEELQNIYHAYVMRVDSNINIDSVILSDDNKNKLNGFLEEVRYKDKFATLGLSYINRLLFYGASGTGKTFLTKALSNHLGYHMLYIDIQKALTQGNPAGAISDMFKLANALGNCILFLDECDAISWDRSETDSSDSTMRRANNALFQQLDQMNPACVFVSATNLYDHIDPAFKRRFNLEFKFDRPDLTKIEESINSMIVKSYFNIVDDMNPYIKDLIIEQARNWTALSYDGVRTWVERAEKKTIMEDSKDLRMSLIWDYFMLDMNLAVDTANNGQVYLYKKG